jgi:hypothetical protein
MPRKIKLSPVVFLILEFFMLFPSVLFMLGVVKYGLIQNVFMVIIGPLAGGFVAYNYLERYKLGNETSKIAKIFIAYSIIEIGIVVFSTLTS